MKIKNIILTIVFSIAILFISLTNVKAVTITETTDDDKYDTIADNTIIIGITKFEPNEVLTAGKASLATFNDFLFNVKGEAYELPKIYYYLQGSWFVIDEENVASVVEDKKELEELKSLDIYYVNNEEKMLEVPYQIGLEKGYELAFKSNDSGKDEKIQYKDGVIYIPATLHTVTVAIKETATGGMTEIETLTKTEDNNTAFKSSTVEVATKDELKAALEDKAVTKIILNADIAGTSETFTISRTLEFDGKGHTITGNKNIFHVLGKEATLTINNVKLVANDSATAIKVGDQNLGTDKHLKAVIGKDVEITSKYFGVTVFGENSTVDFYGKINITDDGYGISGNGLEKYAGKTVINVKEGAEIKSENGYALYLPQDGTANIEGGTLEGASVVGLKAGKLNVTGGTLKATGAKVALPSASYNGKASTGDVIAVEVNESYTGGKTNKNIKVNVTGGTLESTNAYIIFE